MGALVAYITDPARADFQPMNANFGILPPPPGAKRNDRKEAQLLRAREAAREFAARVNAIREEIGKEKNSEFYTDEHR